MIFSHGKIGPSLILFAVLLALAAGSSPAMTLTAGLGRPAPNRSLNTLDGQTVNISTLKGEKIILLFGATSCPHCRSALRNLENISQAYGDDLIVFFIALGQNADQLNRYFDSQLPSYTVIPDENALFAKEFRITRIPVFAFIDEAGLIRHMGRFNEKIIPTLLSSDPPEYPQNGPANASISDKLAGKAAHPSPTGRYIVKLNEPPGHANRLSKAALKAERARFDNAAKKIGARIIHNYGKLKNGIVVEIPPEKADKLRQLPKFDYYKEDRRVRALLEDSVYQIQADYAWNNAITGQDVKVCVVDTGIDPTHPDLQGKVIAEYDATADTDNAMDDNGHGTHCAGIIASQGATYRGASYGASLLAAKTLDYSGNGYESDVILGVEWCVEQGADVINLSLGEGLYDGTCDFDEMAQAVNEAVDAGVVVACAAGNDGDLARMASPACASKAIAVGAVDKTDNLASYSDGGSELDLVAPGGDQFGGTHFPEIVSTFSTEVANNPLYCLYLVDPLGCLDQDFAVDGYRYIRAVGTSMAAPHVAAAAALLLEENPSLTPQQVKTLLEQTADDLGTPGWDPAYGWGRINLQKAIDNIPPQTGELVVNITEPNASHSALVSEKFDLSAEVGCFGGDGCGDVLVYAEFCQGRDCDQFEEISEATAVSTLDNNPNSIGILSGYSVDANAPLLFDAQTMLDISEATYQKSLNPAESFVGSTLPGQYSTGDLQEEDGVGAIGENVEVRYDFQIPAGTLKNIKVRMENYIVLHHVYPPYAGWYVYTSNAAGENLRLIGDCIPPEGGGGETPSPDCWFVSDDPDTLADLAPGQTNYIKLVSHDVDQDSFGLDWLTFNDIEVIVEYQPDPQNDSVYRYYAAFDLSQIDPDAELTAARLEINVTQPAADAMAQIHLADNTLISTATARDLYEPNLPDYSDASNPIKTFNCEDPGTVALSVKAAVEEALLAGQNAVAFLFTERDNNQLIALAAGAAQSPPRLTISQKVYADPCDLPPEDQPQNDPNNGPRTLNYDAVITRDVSEDTYTKTENPQSASIGAEFAPEYNSGDLQEEDGVGAIGENAQQHYEFAIPEGKLKRIKVRLEHYIVLHHVYPPYAGWYVYTSNAAGDNLHLVGDCVPAEGGGGEAPSPDCWFVSDDPNTLADLTPGQTNYIKLVSHDVDQDSFGLDWLTFNDIEVVAEYEIDPNNDEVGRYYLKFDTADLPANAEIDSATLNLNIADPAPDAAAAISLVRSTYDPASTPPHDFYNAETADYTSLKNPIKTVLADDAGQTKINVKAALEDAIQSGQSEIAFLIAEQNEDAVFTIDAAAGPNPPSLDVYVKSAASAGLVKWTLTPENTGQFTLRVRAANNIGLETLSDERVIEIYDPNLPLVTAIECMIDAAWRDCKTIQYGDTIQKIRIDASDPQETPEVRLTLTNVPDENDFVDELLTYGDGFFTHDTALTVADSGQWKITATASDSDENTATKTITWNIPYGDLEADLTSPTNDITVPKSSTFDVTANVTCRNAECPDVEMSLALNDPNELIYDDSAPEDYGDIGSTNGYLAVKFTPAEYPAQLQTARFYVYDQTTYPFELNVWDDDGYDWLGAPGAPDTQLMTPIRVDPVAPSTPIPDPEVAWFDIDLSDRNIVINSGSFYIGFRQIEEGKLNQVGFDMSGPSYAPYYRSWGMLPGWGWLNLNDLCGMSPDVCGNLMIRALMMEPGAYAGALPTKPGPSPFYTTDTHPKPCDNAELKPDQQCQATIKVRATGAAGQKSTLQAIAANNFKLDKAPGLKATITAPLTPCDAANLDAIYPVNHKDFAVFANQWRNTAHPLTADINNDGQTNFEDIARLAEHWLTPCQ